MANLNKTQKKFRKEMEELKKDENNIDTMYGHDSYYNNKAYQNKSNYKNSRNFKPLFITFILIFVLITLFKSKDLILSNFKSIESLNNFTKNSSLITDISPDIELQIQVGKYHKEYTNRIELLNVIMINIIDYNYIQNSDILKIQEQGRLVEEYISSFNRYLPEDINKNLHKYNLEQLYNYQLLYSNAELLASGYIDNQIIDNFNNANRNIQSISDEFREEIISIFNELNMKYTILDNKRITFTVPNFD